MSQTSKCRGQWGGGGAGVGCEGHERTGFQMTQLEASGLGIGGEGGMKAWCE